jgi:TonB-dependent receptor
MNKMLPRLVALATCLAAGSAFADGRIEGRVIAGKADAFLEGALVRITDLNRSASTDKTGRFSFGNVPAGSHTVVVEYLGADSERTTVVVEENAVARVQVSVGRNIDEIIVRGALGGNAASLNQQRSADNVLSVISSADIRALPNSNLAEAAQRAPGVYLERDQGEGRFIGIRGIDPNLNLTTINGAFIPSPESGARSVALDVIPSDLLEAIEISKTFTPDMEGSAIGGTINVRSLSAFQREGRSMSLGVEGSYNGLVEETSPKIDGTFTNVFSVGQGTDNFGIAFAASWFEREFGSDNVETDGGWFDDLETVDGTEFKGAEEIEQRSYTITRERIGVALNFDWRNDGGLYYWRNLYSDFSDQEFRSRNELLFDDGEAVVGTDTSAQWTGAGIDKQMKDRLEEQTIFSTVIGGENYFNRWTFDYSYAFSQSDETEPDRLDTEFELEGVNLGYTSIGPTPNVVLGDEAFRAENFVIKEFEYLDGKAEDTTNTVQANALAEIFSNAYNGNVKFGFLYRTREKDYSADNIFYEDPTEPTLSPFAAPSPRYGLTPFGPGLDAGAIRSYFFQNRDSLEVAEDDTLVGSTAANYVINEDVTAAYLMSTYENGPMRIVYGVRYEGTDFTADGARIVIVDEDAGGTGEPEAVPQSFDRTYDNVLPSINLRYEAGNFVVRGAVTQTMARPNFEELRPGGEIEVEGTELRAEIGNPELDPVESTNVDVGFEWYPGGVSVISAGLFYKDLENFIVTADVGGVIDLTDIIGDAPVDDVEVIQPINGDSAELLGIEASFVHQFESGLYLSANGTWVDSEATYFDRPDKTQLPRTPDLVLNGSVGWESQLFSLRLAATYRDTALLGFEELTDPNFDVFQDEHTQVDFSAKWNVTPALQLNFAAINLTDEPFYAYFGQRQFNAQYEEYGRTYSLGLRWIPTF